MNPSRESTEIAHGSYRIYPPLDFLCELRELTMKASSSYVLRVSEVVDRNSLGQRLRNPDTINDIRFD